MRFVEHGISEEVYPRSFISFVAAPDGFVDRAGACAFHQARVHTLPLCCSTGRGNHCAKLTGCQRAMLLQSFMYNSGGEAASLLLVFSAWCAWPLLVSYLVMALNMNNRRLFASLQFFQVTVACRVSWLFVPRSVCKVVKGWRPGWRSNSWEGCMSPPSAGLACVQKFRVYCFPYTTQHQHGGLRTISLI